MGRRYEIWRCEVEKFRLLETKVVRAAGGRGRGGEEIVVLGEGRPAAYAAGISGVRELREGCARGGLHAGGGDRRKNRRRGGLPMGSPDLRGKGESGRRGGGDVEKGNTGQRGGVVLWRRWRRGARRTRLGESPPGRDTAEDTGWPGGVGEAGSQAAKRCGVARELCGVVYYASSEAASGGGGSLSEDGSL